MNEHSIYKDIATRTGGDIYIGVVGPVRSGKSTFIKRFMESLVLPNMNEGYDREKQKKYFELQMQLAKKLSLPVCVHDREAHGPCFDMVLEHPSVTGVFHSFSGSAEMARELVKRGWYISFSGVLTFKNAARVREVAASVPLDRILIETDAPYLAPHPFRGKLNHSGLTEYTATTLAEIKGIAPDEAAKITFDNAERLFSLCR